jgi:hypothetical protein
VVIPADVRRQALHPFQELLLPVGWKRVEGEHVLICFHTYPIAQVVEPINVGPGGSNLRMSGLGPSLSSVGS